MLLKKLVLFGGRAVTMIGTRPPVVPVIPVTLPPVVPVLPVTLPPVLPVTLPATEAGVASRWACQTQLRAGEDQQVVQRVHLLVDTLTASTRTRTVKTRKPWLFTKDTPGLQGRTEQHIQPPDKQLEGLICLLLVESPPSVCVFVCVCLSVRPDEPRLEDDH